MAAFLASPAAPDTVVRVLFRLRGLRTDATIADAFARMGFEELHRSPVEVVVGASGTPWRPRGGIRPFAAGDPGTVRMATDIRAEHRSRVAASCPPRPGSRPWTMRRDDRSGGTGASSARSRR